MNFALKIFCLHLNENENFQLNFLTISIFLLKTYIVGAH